MKEDVLKRITESEDFDFEAFRKEVVAGFKAGRPLLGIDAMVRLVKL